jgi:hypothetical protein
MRPAFLHIFIRCEEGLQIGRVNSSSETPEFETFPGAGSRMVAEAAKQTPPSSQRDERTIAQLVMFHLLRLFILMVARTVVQPKVS